MKAPASVLEERIDKTPIQEEVQVLSHYVSCHSVTGGRPSGEITRELVGKLIPVHSVLRGQAQSLQTYVLLNLFVKPKLPHLGFCLDT